MADQISAPCSPFDKYDARAKAFPGPQSHSTISSIQLIAGYIYMYSYIYIYMCMYTCSIRKEDRICASYRAKKCPSENWAEAEGVDQESLSSKHSSSSHFNRLSSPLLCTAAVCSQISLHNKESGALSLPAHHLLALLQHRRLPHLVL